MDILIKNVDAPTDHAMGITIFPEGFAIVEVWEWAIPIKTMKCKVSFLPPHGRLIDADALSMEFWKMRSSYQMMDNSQTADKIMHGLYRAEQAINEASTIIEAEE